MARDWKWRCRALLPRSAKGRAHCCHTIHGYLLDLRQNLYLGMTCTMEESPASPFELIIHFEWRFPPDTEELAFVSFKIQKDIDALCNNYLGETGPVPKSVWEWLRVRDPYAP